MLTILLNSTPKARRILWCLRSLIISSSRDPKNLTAAAKVENSTLYLHGAISIFQLTLFQIPQILSTISSGHDVIYTPAPFSCLEFIMTIVLSFARERKTAPNDYAPELLTRIVQSPTKLNDKI